MHSDNEMVNLLSVIETLLYMVDEDSDGVEEVMQLPTIDLVRCNECKHWRSDGGAIMFCEHTDFPTNADDFCSYGEREGE